MKKNENSSIFEDRGFMGLHQTGDGYKVFAGWVISNLEKKLHLEIEGGPQNSWIEIKIPDSSLRKPNAVLKTVDKKFDNLIDELATVDTKQAVANAIEAKWELIPTIDLGSLTSPTAIYHRLFQLAEGKTEGIIFMHDGCCWILAKELKNILAEQRFNVVKCRLLNTYKILGLLDKNAGRPNDIYRKFPGMEKQDHFICLRPMEQQTEPTDNGVTVYEVPAEAKERYVESGDGQKNIAVPYPGGKNNIPMQEKIQALIPYNITKMADLFVGSGSVSYNCRKAKYFHLNDLDSNMSNLHSVITDGILVQELLCVIEKCNFTKEEFAEALERSEKSEHTDKVEWAMDELLLLYTSFNADRTSYYIKEDAEQLKQRIKHNIGRVCAKAQKCEITVTNENAWKLLKEYCERGDADTFIYLDPPYLDELISSNHPLYRQAASEEEHEKMLQIIQNAKCPILLSGYKKEKSEEDLYCKYLDKEHGWVCLQLGEFHKASSRKQGSIGIEYVWLNYFDRLPENAKYLVSMKNHGLEKGGACNE